VGEMIELLAGIVFPAGAGMNRMLSNSEYTELSVPRRRGDEPFWTWLIYMRPMCSPQARG